ncbi:hypothetical protein HN51_041132 [Arachis hypogaea]
MRRCDRNHHSPLRLHILMSQNLSIPLVTTQSVSVKTAHSLFSVTKKSEECQVGLGNDEPRWRTEMVVMMNRDISNEHRSMIEKKWSLFGETMSQENADNFAKLKGLLQGIVHATSNFELSSLWLPSRFRSKYPRFIETFGTHIVVGMKMGGKDVIYLKQQHSLALQPADVQKRLKEMADRRFMDATG